MALLGGSNGDSRGLRPVDVAEPQASGRGDRCRLAAKVDGRSVWFESRDLPLAASSEAFGAALLVAALHAGRPLRLAGVVCETWAANLARLTDEFRSLWYPDAPRPLAVPGQKKVAAGILPAESVHHGQTHSTGKMPVATVGEPGSTGKMPVATVGEPGSTGKMPVATCVTPCTRLPEVAAGILPAECAQPCPTHSTGKMPVATVGESTRPTALCFSGGVDAFHSLLAGGHPIDMLVYVVGYDVSHRDRYRAAAVTALLRDVAAEMGCNAAAITTNLRRHPLVKRTPWLRAFAGPLAAVGHLLGPTVGRMLISSDGLGFEHPEVGARPSTDPLHGSARLAVEHAGHAISRLDKIAAIAGERLVQRHLRVCWHNRRGSRGRLNCGRCEKCVRTMLAIDACGLLGRFPGFDHGRGLVAGIDALPKVDGVVESFYRDLLARGLSAPAAAAVQRLVARSTAPRTRLPEVAAGILPAECAQPCPTHSTGKMPVATVGEPGSTGKMPVAPPTRHRLLTPAAFAHVCEPLIGRRVGYVRPEGNVGDHLIEVAMIELFAEYGIRWQLVRPDCPADTAGLDLLAFGGGGNMGTRYTGNHALRTQALATGLPVVILPQSFTSPENRPFATVFVRERGSLALRPDGVLAPDLALGLATCAAPRPTHELGVFLRRDQERGGRKPFFVRDPVRMHRDPFRYLAMAARYRRIVTDRLHFAVAGLHAGRDVTLVANDYHKNRSMHETWLADLGCRFAATAAEALGRRAA
jgi:hypothetical protein